MEYLGFALIAIGLVGLGLFLVSKGRIFENHEFLITSALTYAFIIAFVIGTREWLPFLDPESLFYTVVKYLTPLVCGAVFLTITYWCFKEALWLRHNDQGREG